MDEHALFAAALEIDAPDERSAYLDRACGDDDGLRARIEALLRAHEQAGSFLQTSPLAGSIMPEAPKAPEGPGTVMGPYKLLQTIGEGGMGTVYMAEQTHPVRRLVALKVIKAGMDTRLVLARFDAERQALALMDHPNIARVLDAGMVGPACQAGSHPSDAQTGPARQAGPTDAQTAPARQAGPTGRPYFVMELVKGVPITRYCDDCRLTLRERLELFVPVCQAVQHAHQKGIIHRDLKPSNILVAQYDGQPVPKVIDFGVAKATGPRLTEQTLYTEFGAVIGTLEYMSPEQAELNQFDIDTRSDVYSLGAILYELLTGSTPLGRERLKAGAFVEMLRIIREEDSPRPSLRLSTTEELPTIAACRQVEPGKLSGLVRGELDWIVMKALEKDRNRRYETPSALAADLHRFLTDQPVEACPPSAAYRFRKLARRHKGTLAAVLVILVVSLAGTAVSTWQAVRATRAERMTRGALAQMTAAQTQTYEALDALINGVVETMFAKQPQLDETEKAFLRTVVDIYEGVTGQSGETADARFLRAKGYFRVAHLRGLLGERKEAATGYRQAEILLGQLAAESPGAAEFRHKLAILESNLGIQLAELGEEAEAAFRQGIALRTKLSDDFPENPQYRLELAINYQDLGLLKELQHKYQEAEAAYRRALGLKEKLVAEAGAELEYHLELSRTLTRMGQLLRKQEKYAESEKIYRQALKAQEEPIGKGPATAKDRQWLADSYSGLGIALAELKRHQEAEHAFRQMLEVRRKLVDDFPSVLEYRRALANGTKNLGYFLTRQGRDAAAEEPYRQELELRKAIVKQAGPIPGYRRELAESYDSLAWVQSVTRQPKEAESAWRAALELWQPLAVDSPQVPDFQAGLGGTLTNLANLQNQRGEFAAAAALLEKARTHLQAALDARPKDRGFRKSYRDQLVAQAQSRLGLADRARLAQTADELAGFGYDPAGDTYHAACLLCRCVPPADKDAHLAEAGRKERSRGYVDRALVLLRQAVARGYKDVARMKQDPDLEPLRARDEFRKLLAELEGKKNE
jgi:serine/threonine protein kinase/tetratricopeptide (TPR) repeat protein